MIFISVLLPCDLEFRNIYQFPAYFVSRDVFVLRTLEEFAVANHTCNSKQTNQTETSEALSLNKVYFVLKFCYQ